MAIRKATDAPQVRHPRIRTDTPAPPASTQANQMSADLHGLEGWQMSPPGIPLPGYP